ncbi:uncharacterized protein LODBEIA_P24130 [Lodderomyces beijingensis]|uniref:Ribonuclease P/MRP protein subunit POP5 n=1 Tax=Lodderomyces beijingensis TaxID=1775926 RepID=A0ABP0ZJ70_9ASCO
MVRVKHRYILFEILYPPSASPSSADFHELAKSQQSCLLALHKPTPSGITQRTILHAIRKSLEIHYGDIAAGSAGQLMSVRYFSNKTSTGIIRCDRDQLNWVVGAMTLVTKLRENSENGGSGSGEGDHVILRCVHASGTIKKCEEFSVRYSTRLMSLLGSSRSHEMHRFVEEVELLKESDDEVAETDDSV